MEAVRAMRPTKRFILSRHRIDFRKPSRTTALVATGAGVAAISLGTALMWPAFAASNAGNSAPGRVTVTKVTTQEFATTTSAFEMHKLRVTRDSAWRRATERKVKEEARRAAERRAARIAAARAARLAAERARQQRAAQQAGSSGSSAPSGSPQQIAGAMLSGFGWGQDQFGCLDSLWAHESGWSTTAANPSSGAYGIPQALPGSKMASAGPDWQTNAATQIRWGLGYIKSLYGSPCGAWSHEQATGYY